jgi:hypothetical protein
MIAFKDTEHQPILGFLVPDDSKKSKKAPAPYKNWYETI